MQRYMASWWDRDCQGVRHRYGASHEEALAKAKEAIAATQAEVEAFHQREGSFFGPIPPARVVAENLLVALVE